MVCVPLASIFCQAVSVISSGGRSSTPLTTHFNFTVLPDNTSYSFFTSFKNFGGSANNKEGGLAKLLSQHLLGKHGKIAVRTGVGLRRRTS